MIRMEVASSRLDHLPTLSAAKASKLSLLVESPFGGGMADAGNATPTFCFTVSAISKLTTLTRTNKSPLLVSYLFSIGDPRHPSPLCPLCLMHDHTSSHLFECKSLPTSLSSLDLWTNPDKVEPFLATWGERLLAAT